MSRTPFFRGLFIGLFVSAFLWSGIIYGVSNLMQDDTNDIQKEHVETEKFARVVE